MSSNTVTIHPQLRVMLRNKTHAVITHGVGGLPPFSLMGHSEGDRSAVHLWQRSGHWQEKRQAHALDIVALYSADGGLVAFTGININLAKGQP